MIEFKECILLGYPARTKENIKNTDLTIAFALDFTTPGEKLTKNTAGNYGKLYLPWEINTSHILDLSRMEELVKKIKTWYLPNTSFKINIAGNGIYRLVKDGYDQDEVDFGMEVFLNSLKGFIKIEEIVTGGQTGIDEAGAKAADKLGIKATILAPKGWMFRNIQGIDISNEQLFKERFNQLKKK